MFFRIPIRLNTIYLLHDISMIVSRIVSVPCFTNTTGLPTSQSIKRKLVSRCFKKVTERICAVKTGMRRLSRCLTMMLRKMS